MGKLSLFKEAISRDKEFSALYLNLANFLLRKKIASIELNDGRQMTAKELYVKAWQYDDPSRSIKPLTYKTLGDMLSVGETIKLPGVGNVDKKQLLAEALRYDPSQTEIYRTLIEMLKKDETINIPGQGVFTKEKLIDTYLDKSRPLNVEDRLYLVKGTDDDKPAWYFVLVDEDKMKDFLINLGEPIIHLEDHGEVLKSGYGKEPPKEVKDAVYRKLGIKE
jgi:hypothetical protein